MVAALLKRSGKKNLGELGPLKKKNRKGSEEEMARKRIHGRENERRARPKQRGSEVRGAGGETYRLLLLTGREQPSRVKSSTVFKNRTKVGTPTIS